MIRPMEAPDVPDLDDNFKLDSDQVNEEWLNEKGRIPKVNNHLHHE